MRAIIFDLYNTLIYTTERKSPYVDFFNSLGMTKSEIKEWLNNILTNNYDSFEDIYKIINPDKYLYTQKWDYDVEEEILNTNVFDDTYHILDKLRKEYKLFLLSNVSTPYKESFYKLGLNQYFEKAFFSCDIRYRKPQPEAFQYVLDSTGLKKNQLLMIGDSLSSDFNGAIDFGIKALLKNKPLSQLYPDIISFL